MNDRGFTIIEFIIYLAIVATTLVSATYFAFEFISTQRKSEAIQEVNRNLRLAITRLGIEMREASDVNTGASTFDSSAGVLSLASATVGANPTLFCVTSGTLRISQGDATCDATDPALTSSRVTVTDFTLNNLSTAGRTKAVRARLTLEYVNTSNLQELVATATAETTAIINKNDGFSN